MLEPQPTNYETEKERSYRDLGVAIWNGKEVHFGTNDEQITLSSSFTFIDDDGHPLIDPKKAFLRIVPVHQKGDKGKSPLFGELPSPRNPGDAIRNFMVKHHFKEGLPIVGTVTRFDKPDIPLSNKINSGNSAVAIRNAGLVGFQWSWEVTVMNDLSEEDLTKIGMNRNYLLEGPEIDNAKAHRLYEQIAPKANGWTEAQAVKDTPEYGEVFWRKVDHQFIELEMAKATDLSESGAITSINNQTLDAIKV